LSLGAAMAERRARSGRFRLETGFVALVGAATIWAGWGFWRDRELPRRLTQVRIGMDRKSAEAVLGAPDWEGGCAGRVAYLPRAECARELGFHSAFAPIRPVYYLIQLDRNGRVIEAEPIRTR
jgi:hypothetical protein